MPRLELKLALACVLLLALSCSHPDYGDTPFLCGNAGECPDDYTCQQNVCVREGQRGQEQGAGWGGSWTGGACGAGGEGGTGGSRRGGMEEMRVGGEGDAGCGWWAGRGAGAPGAGGQGA